MWGVVGWSGEASRGIEVGSEGGGEQAEDGQGRKHGRPGCKQSSGGVGRED